MALSDEATRIKRAFNRKYQEKYRKQHKDELNQKAKDYRRKNPERVRATMERYWEKKAIQEQEKEIKGNVIRIN